MPMAELLSRVYSWPLQTALCAESDFTDVTV